MAVVRSTSLRIVSRYPLVFRDLLRTDLPLVDLPLHEPDVRVDRRSAGC